MNETFLILLIVISGVVISTIAVWWKLNEIHERFELFQWEKKGDIEVINMWKEEHQKQVEANIRICAERDTYRKKIEKLGVNGLDLDFATYILANRKDFIEEDIQKAIEAINLILKK